MIREIDKNEVNEVKDNLIVYILAPYVHTSISYDSYFIAYTVCLMEKQG